MEQGRGVEAPAQGALKGARQAAGALLLLLATLPLYRLLATAGTGHAGRSTIAMTSEYAAYVWSAFALVLILALLLARLVAPERLEGALHAGRTALLHPKHALFAAFAAIAAAVLTWHINHNYLFGEPTLIDAMSQLVHARYLAAGRLAGPTDLVQFWHAPQLLATPNGWVSQYPPGHAALLALGLRLGAVELVGPVLVGMTVLMTSLLAHRVLEPVSARIGTLLLAGSSFAAAQAAAYMNHSTAALFAVCALYAAVRARQDGGALAAAATGLSLGLLLFTRPLTAVVVGVVALLALTGALEGRREFRIPARPLLAAALGALPLLLLLLVYNQHFFGSPFRFGYTASLGPDGGLGFGTDPWGNHYDLRAAAGYTSAELSALNLFLLESPLPVVALAALYLVLAPRLAAGVRLVATAALLPLLAHAFYWHHGLYMGPRMLAEYTPAWCLLVAAAAVGLVRGAPARLRALPAWSPRVFAAAAFFAAWLFAVVVGVPGRIATYRSPILPVPQIARMLPEPGVVFVHGQWAARLAMRLAAEGMRSDSLETLMRRNSTCSVQRWVDAGRREVDVDFDRSSPVFLPSREVAPGSTIRVAEGELWSARCAREAYADRWGVVEVAPYLWRAGLPGIDDGATVLARDLGPRENAMLIERLRLPAYVLRVQPRSGVVSLAPYPSAIRAIWPENPGGIVAP